MAPYYERLHNIGRDGIMRFANAPGSACRRFGPYGLSAHLCPRIHRDIGGRYDSSYRVGAGHEEPPSLAGR